MTGIIATVICLTLAAPPVAAAVQSPEADSTKRLILLPEPQQVNYSPGTCKLTPERFIFLDINSPEIRLNIGRIIQQSLAKWDYLAVDCGERK